MNRQELENYFKERGLLVHTVQLEHLGANFKCLTTTENQTSGNTEGSKYDSPKKNWSIAHPDIKPNFYKMGKDVCGFPRHIAIMAVPSLIDWTKYLAISSQDMSSNSRISKDTKPLDPQEAMSLYDKVLAQLKKSTPTEQNQNSEVSTLGFDIKAFCGLLFHGTEEWWNANKGKVKSQLEVLKTLYEISEVDVYTYNADNESANKTELTYKEKMHL